MLWRTILALLAFIAVMGTIGLIQRKRKAEGSGKEDPDRVSDNVVDLNDRFNRARYMDQDKAQ